MIIVLASDHAGYTYKEFFSRWLTTQGHSVIDVGADRRIKNDDYPIYARMGAQAVTDTPKAVGIFFCGSGVGMSVAANRFLKIRAVNAESVAVARRSRDEENANVLVLGSRITSRDKAKKIISTWLATPFSKAQRHKRRIKMLSKLTHGK